MGLRDIESYYSECPEPRFELVDGRFFVGNDLRGNRYIMSALLEGWGLEAAIPFAPAELWLQALGAAFKTEEPPSPASSLDEWIAWAEQVTYDPTIESAGPRDDRLHRGICNRLRFALFGKAHETCIGQCYNRIVMRLGEDAWMPDLLFVSSSHSNRVKEYYVDGPGDIVMEVIMPGHEDRDRHDRHRKYEAGSVPEYWIIDPQRRAIEFLRLVDGEYSRQAINTDGRYRPPGVPGLAIVPEHLWEGLDDLGWHVPNDDPPLFEVDEDATTVSVGEPESSLGDSDGWGSVSFSPQIRLQPSVMDFRDYISWCPEPKFEVIDGKPLIAGTAGTHDLIGFLIQSLGLVDVVRLRPPRTWMQGLKQRQVEIATDTTKRKSWWREVRAVAELLRDDFGFESVTAIGDLVRDRPLSIWSSFTLVVDRVPYGISLSEAYRAIYDSHANICIGDLREFERLNPTQREEYESHGVQL